MNIYRNKMNNCKNYIYIYFSNYNFNLSVLLGEYLFFKTVKFLFVCGLSIVLRDLCILGMNCSTSNPKPFLFADRSSLRCPLPLSLSLALLNNRIHETCDRGRSHLYGFIFLLYLQRFLEVSS